jgi:AraC-like DNA-binding protein
VVFKEEAYYGIFNLAQLWVMTAQLVILDQMQGLSVAPLHLPMPRDPRLQAIAQGVLRDPADPRTLTHWARDVGASTRILARLFLADTGLTFRHWCQQARLLEALRRLASREPVTAVALDLGYDSPSAFIAMFKRALGTTPGRYFAS